MSTDQTQLQSAVIAIAQGIIGGEIDEETAHGINSALTVNGLPPIDIETVPGSKPNYTSVDYNADVLKFHEGVGGVGGTIGRWPEIRTADLRADLVLEEAREFAQAVLGKKVKIKVTRKKWKNGPDLAAAIDGICDILYVTHGAAIAFGVYLPPFWREVQRTNMLKLKGPVRSDGKRLKPKGWQPPRIREILQQQLLSPSEKRVELAESFAVARKKSLQENA